MTKDFNPEETIGRYDDDAPVDETDVKNKFLTVHNRHVKDEISTDIRLAKHSEAKDKKFINDMGCIRGDAIDLQTEYFSLIEDYWEKIKDGVEKYSKVHNIPEEEMIKGMTQNVPLKWELWKGVCHKSLKDVFSRRIDWTTNLNINVANNYLAKLMVGNPEPDEEEENLTRLEKEFKDMKKHFANKEE